MKKLLVFLLSISYLMSMGVDINHLSPDIRYIELIGYSTKRKTSLYIDYGQEKKRKNHIWDNGAIITFDTVAGALNYFKKNGWDYVGSTRYMYSDKERLIYTLKRSK